MIKNENQNKPNKLININEISSRKRVGHECFNVTQQMTMAWCIIRNIYVATEIVFFRIDRI